MAGAKLEFDGGWLGIERCADATNGEQFFMAHIHTASRGLTVNAPVAIEDVIKFADNVRQQVKLARGAR